MPRLSMPKGFKKQDLMDLASVMSESLSSPTAYKNLTSSQLMDWLERGAGILEEDNQIPAMVGDDFSLCATLVAFGILDSIELENGSTFMAGVAHIKDVEEEDDEFVYQCGRAEAKSPAKKEKAEKKDMFENPGFTTKIGMLLVDEVILDRATLDKRIEEEGWEVSPSTTNTVYSHVGKMVKYMVRQGTLVASEVEETEED